MGDNVPKIIIVGKMRSGKSPVSDRLRLDYGFTELAFGAALKYYAHRVFAYSNVIGEGKPRALYQQFGELCREIDPLVWVKHVDAAYKQVLDSKSTKGIVVSDGRQPHEYEWARANGFTVVRVTAPDELRLERARKAGDDFTEADLAHDTEQWVDKFDVDFEIVNDGKLDDLCAKVDDVMSKIKEYE